MRTYFTHATTGGRFLAAALATHLSVRAGYSRWLIYSRERLFGESDIKLKLAALTLGLELHF